MEKKPKKLLFYGDFNCDTGFGQVSKKLIENFSKDKNLQIQIFAINDHSEKPYSHSEFKNVSIIPALAVSRTKKDVYCRIEFLNLLYRENFDVVFFLNDVEVFNQMNPNLREVKSKRAQENKPKQKTILYFPIDSAPRKSDLDVLSYFDEVITYTEYAKQTMKPLVSESIFKKIKVINHGCDTETFKPLDPEEISKIKKDIFGTDEVFVVGTVNRNSARKDLGTLILGYSIFKNKHPEAKTVLYLHCNPFDKAGINIDVLCQRLGLVFGKDVITPKDYSENKGYAPEKLNEVYNSFDCFITTTTAEGWGLSVTEAMATKKLVACPKHTSLNEITQNGSNCFGFIFSHPRVFVNDFEKVRFASDPIEVATVIENICNIAHESEEIKNSVNNMIERAYTHVKKYSWSITAKKFKAIIDKLSK